MAKTKDETAADPRQAAWEAFLVKARVENPDRFDAQEANGEFATIPDSFQ